MEIHQCILRLQPKSLTHNNQPVAFDIFVPFMFHPSKIWWQRYAIIDYMPAKFHGLISKNDGDIQMYPYIMARITHIQQSKGRIIKIDGVVQLNP